jgi:hypothetical protein
LLGTCGETRQGIELIQGNDQPQLGADAHFPETQVMLDAFNRLPHQASLYRSSLCIRLQEVFKKWDENTSTSPSGKHLGLQSTPLLAHQEPSLTDPADDIINLKIKLLTSLTNGHVWDRWKRHRIRHDREEAGSILLEKLHHPSFEADYKLDTRPHIWSSWSTMNNKTI